MLKYASADYFGITYYQKEAQQFDRSMIYEWRLITYIQNVFGRLYFLTIIE